MEAVSCADAPLLYKVVMAFDPIEITRFSTADLPPEERHQAWQSWGWPRTDLIYRTDPTEPFDTYWENALLGEVVFVYTRITGMRYERRLQDVRVSDFDPIVVNMMIEGSARGLLEDREFREQAGEYHFHDLTKRSIHTSSASRTYSVVIPRTVAIRVFGSLDDLHGLVVRGATADLLLAHAHQVHRALPHLDRDAAPALGRSFLDLLVAALAHVRAATPSVSSAALRLRERAASLIDSRMNKPLSVKDLCNELKVSRTSLAAAFNQDGGVQSYIRAARLERAKAALSDRERNEAIGLIAARLGFYDASHLSRLFRLRYGMTPRHYRGMLVSDAAQQSSVADYPAPT